MYIYTNLPVDVIVRLPHPRSGDRQGQETFLAPSADKETCNYDKECSNLPATLYIYIQTIMKKLEDLDLLEDLKISLLHFSFFMIYIIHKMLVLLKTHLNFLKVFWNTFLRSIILFKTYSNGKFKS